MVELVKRFLVSADEMEEKAKGVNKCWGGIIVAGHNSLDISQSSIEITGDKPPNIRPMINCRSSVSPDQLGRPVGGSYCFVGLSQHYLNDRLNP